MIASYLYADMAFGKRNAKVGSGESAQGTGQMLRVAMAVASAAILVAPAMADEMWKTDYGQVIWEKDYDGGAIFKIDLAGGGVGRMYVEGLATEVENRGHFKGYWISTTEEDMCSAELKGPDGTKSRTWGTLTLSFRSPEFPSDWVLMTGECLGVPDSLIAGHADTGE